MLEAFGNLLLTNCHVPKIPPCGFVRLRFVNVYCFLCSCVNIQKLIWPFALGAPFCHFRVDFTSDASTMLHVCNLVSLFLTQVRLLSQSLCLSQGLLEEVSLRPVVTVLIYCPPYSTQVFPLFHILPNSQYCRCCKFCQFDVCKMVFHCGLIFISMIVGCKYLHKFLGQSSVILFRVLLRCYALFCVCRLAFCFVWEWFIHPGFQWISGICVVIP